MLLRTPPRPPAVPAALYSRRILQDFAAGEHAAFMAAGGRPMRPRQARALALAGLRPGLRVADVGCGRGEATIHAARRGAQVSALDFSPDSLLMTGETMAAVLTRDQRDRVSLVQADAGRLPLRDGSMDRVLLLDIVEHLWGWQLDALLAETARVLAPGGLAVIHTLPNRWALDYGYPLLRLVSPGLPPQPRSAYERAVHVNEQDPRRLRRSLHRASLAHRVWLEGWTGRQAARGRGRPYPDAARALGYPAIDRPWLRRWGRRILATPLRAIAANDIFALAWRADGSPPPVSPRWRVAS